MVNRNDYMHDLLSSGKTRYSSAVDSQTENLVKLDLHLSVVGIPLVVFGRFEERSLIQNFVAFVK